MKLIDSVMWKNFKLTILRYIEMTDFTKIYLNLFLYLTHIYFFSFTISSLV